MDNKQKDNIRIMKGINTGKTYSQGVVLFYELKALKKGQTFAILYSNETKIFKCFSIKKPKFKGQSFHTKIEDDVIPESF